MTLLTSAPRESRRASLPAPSIEPARERPALAAWSRAVLTPATETAHRRTMARVGGSVATCSLICYLLWRVLATVPASGPFRWAAFLLVAFEALPLFGSVTKLVTWWSIDAPAAPAVETAPGGMRVAVLIPTYNEPAEVVGPTIAAARELEPAHETWVLDDGDRAWLRDLCRTLDVRYVTRTEHAHAKAGNLNHALGLMAREEAAGATPIDLVAVLDCDHVPLPGFLTATLGYFEDEKMALVQGPQAFFNGGAFDDDGYTGEQGLFFNVQLAARQRAGAGTFWCGSTSVLRVAALRAVGGVAQETVTEDLHTTLKLQRLGWRTAYHHQTLALGLAPETPEQYLVQRRRWGMGAMQVLVAERLWRRQKWMSLRTQLEYLASSLWWLEGVATLVAMAVPATLLVTGVPTSTVSPGTFLGVFATTFSLRLWGYKMLLRRQIRWRTAFALRVLRVPVGLACAWWLVSRRTLQFAVTPKGASNRRHRGRVPRAVVGLTVATSALIGYASLGLVGYVPWQADRASTVTSGLWLVLALGVLLHAALRIRAEQYATTRRAAHRFPVNVPVLVDGRPAVLVDVSVNGAAVRLESGETLSGGYVGVTLPGAVPLKMEVAASAPETEVAKLTLPAQDWEGLRTLALWLFHTPPRAVAGLPAGIPVVAITSVSR